MLSFFKILSPTIEKTEILCYNRSKKGGIRMSDIGKRRKSLETEQLVYLGVFTSLVIVLQCLASFVFPKLGVSLNLSLIPIVLGAALCNKWAGAWLGFVSAFIILFDPTTVAFMTFSAPATIFLVLVKGMVSGFLGGLVYSLLKSKNKYAAVIVSALVVPFVNTCIFLLGCLTFFYPLISQWANDANANILYYLIVVMVGVNFLIETGANLILSPSITRLIDIIKKS